MDWRENKMMMEKIKERMNNRNNNMLTERGGENDNDDDDNDGAFNMPPPPTAGRTPHNNPYSAVYKHSISIHHHHRSPADFKAFVEYRGEMYAKAVDDGNVPPFIQRWLEYCQRDGGGEYSDDDYVYLGGLLRGAPVEPYSWVAAILKRRGGHGVGVGVGGGKQKVQRINTTTAAAEE
jgi:hypothetical protein